MIDRVPGDHVATIKGSPDLQLITANSSELTYLNFKVDEERVRRRTS